MWRGIGLGAAAAVAVCTGAAAAPGDLPTGARERTVACAAHLMLVAENLTATDDGQEDTRQTVELLLLSLDRWLDGVRNQPDYDEARMTADVTAYMAGPLGSDPGAIDKDQRAANLGTCVNEAPR